MPQPPDRRTADDYHYHVYDFPGAKAWDPGPAQPDRGKQRFYSMVADLEGLALAGEQNQVPNLSLDTLGAQISADGQTFLIQALSFGRSAVESPPTVVFTGGIHAREWIAHEMTYLLAEYLIKNYSPATTGLTIYQQSIQRFVQGRRICIIPMVNPAGNDYSVMSTDAGARMWRPNRNPMPEDAPRWLADVTIQGSAPVETQPPFQDAQTTGGVTSYRVPRYDLPLQYDTIALPNTPTTGVDLNRNFLTTSYGFATRQRNGTYTNGNPGTESYFGPHAASEVETRNMQALFDRLGQIDASIDYHSYGQYILYPTEVFSAGSVDPAYTSLGQVMQRLILGSVTWLFSDDYKLGSPAQIIGYDATGTLADYIGKTRARAFVIELDPTDGVFSDGFELPPRKIMGVFEKNIRGALALLASTYPGVAPQLQVRPGSVLGRQTVGAGERDLLDWNVFGRGNLLPVAPP